MPLDHPDFNSAVGLPSEYDPHLDYQVARFWIDLEEMLPDILDPLPSALARAMASGAWETWRVQVAAWCNALPDDDARGNRRIWHTAVSWDGQRHLDMGYLVAPPIFQLWRMGDTVILTWHTREKRVDGALCWVETQGQITLPVGSS